MPPVLAHCVRDGDETDQLEAAFVAQRLEVPEESGRVVTRHLFFRFRSRLGRLGGPFYLYYRGSKPMASTHRASARKSTVPALKLRESGQLIGIADLLAPHPRGDHAALGLLILHRAWQGKGFGREAAGHHRERLIFRGLEGSGGRGSTGTASVAALLGTMRVSVDGRGDQ